MIAIKGGKKESTLILARFHRKNPVTHFSRGMFPVGFLMYHTEGWRLLYPRVMNAAAPEGTPPRRIGDERTLKHRSAPPCPGGALRRVTFVIFSEFQDKCMNNNSWRGAHPIDFSFFSIPI